MYLICLLWNARIKWTFSKRVLGKVLFMPESTEDVGEGQTTAMSNKK